MPLLKKEEAKESGFAQIRAAMIAFTGDVTNAEFGQWGGVLYDDKGNAKPPREFLEVTCVNVEVNEVTEELAFVPEEWNFRVNCSDYKDTFWIEKFLDSVDANKILLPDGLVGKRIAWKQVTQEARDPKYNSTNFIIDKVVGNAGPAPVVTPASVPALTVAPATPEEAPVDLMQVACDLAVGKTELQFRSAIGLDPQFVGSPILALAKAGAITQALVTDKKLVVVMEGNKSVYKKPE